MADYRICSLDAEGLIREVTSAAFDSDDAAMAAAADRSQHFPIVEIWNNGRMVRSIRQQTEEAHPSTESAS